MLKSKVCRYCYSRGLDPGQACVEGDCRHWLITASKCVLEIIDDHPEGELKESEIACLLGVSVSRVSQLIKRALGKLRKEAEQFD